MTLRNLPEDKPAELSNLIDVKAHQVVSMALSGSDHVNIVLLAFSADENVSDEIYSGDTMYLVLDGNMCVVSENERINVCCGQAVKVAAGKSHRLESDNAFKIMQITVLD